MIHYLLLLQFPLLYCVSIILGLVVYGSDFDELEGWLYLLPLILVPLLHIQVKRHLDSFAHPSIAIPVLAGGLLCAVMAYQSLHFGYWDEHNLQQAVWLSLLGMFSYLSSMVASASMLRQAAENNRLSHGLSLAIALLIIGLAWLPAVAYPMAGIFVVACLMLIGLVFFIGAPMRPLPDIGHDSRVSRFTLAPFKYALFVVCMDMGMIAWDYQVNTQWAQAFAMVFVSTALTVGLFEKRKGAGARSMLIVVMLNFLVTIIWPASVISSLHIVILGLSMGWALSHVLMPDNHFMPLNGIGVAWQLFLGFVLGYLFYANLDYAAYRGLLLLPLVYLLIIYSRKRSHVV